MNTLLPYPNFIGSARVLDSRRLGKQRVENLQIMQTLLGQRVANTNRPVATGEFRKVYFDKDHNEIPVEELDTFDTWYEETRPMTVLVANPREEWLVEDLEYTSWQHHPAVLMWRGYEHALLSYQEAVCNEWKSRLRDDDCWEKTHFLYFSVRPLTRGGLPDWLGSEEFHRSHQSNLLRQHKKYYAQFFHDVPDDLPYVWPVTTGGTDA